VGVFVCYAGGNGERNLAKSLIVSEKTVLIIAHLWSKTVMFDQNSVLFRPSGFKYRFDTQEQSMLFTPTVTTTTNTLQYIPYYTHLTTDHASIGALQ
jgi:hypothetical protein